MHKIAVLLVDDHPILREGLKLLIDSQQDMRVVGEAGDGEDLPALVKECGAEVVVIDVSMPRVSGARATAELTHDRPDIPVLALTRHTETGYLRQMFESGVSGYVLKQTGGGELLKGIRAVARGGSYIDTRVSANMFPSSSRQLQSASPSLLTAREREVLTMTAFGHTNKEIASALDISVKTVEAHKAHLMAKLQITRRTDLVRFAIAQGWLKTS